MIDLFENDLPLTAKAAAMHSGLSLAAFWRAVGTKRLPSPVYPLPRAPRWFASELRVALRATRALPRDQKAARRGAEAARTADTAARNSKSPDAGEGGP